MSKHASHNMKRLRIRNRTRPCGVCGAKAGKPCKKGCTLLSLALQLRERTTDYA